MGRVQVEGGESVLLSCVLDSEPSDKQWQEAEAEACERLLRGEGMHVTLYEVG